MLTDKELMQMALDALERYEDGQQVYFDEEIEALRARLSQCERCGEVNPAEIHTCTPKQEPVAWMEQGKSGEWFLAYSFNKKAKSTKPLYLAPPQRELKADTKKRCWFVRVIEAALKKNT